MTTQTFTDRTGQSYDPFDLRKHYEPLRVVDVCDALDGIGYFNIGLVSEEIRPLWPGMKFWGVAYTLRCVPANKPMWTLESTEDIVAAHARWFDTVGRGALGFNDQLKPGHVVVTDVGGADNVGLWGSENAMGVLEKGGVGIITNGQCRDTGEVTLQKTPMVCKSRGRTIIPGRIEAVETQVPVGIGGAQVRPGDIVGVDDDGVVVVPYEVAPEVARHAKEILLADMRARGKRYETLGMERDETVDAEAIERYYAGLAA
ncbi:RraA family protein [Rhodobacteraceae bacterium 2CG4]|uniref:Putative 4-hydroxy-4-methyl-2-oxoglutarate aldolase n=1 Tax=Halovulum marinum TaxID=2662447 RepID=A0A6L5YZL2_9RHOB|nr:RraA family protein [Halovulum marinum]MSU89340.1 RraA family protein [Halovulum marinum]